MDSVRFSEDFTDYFVQINGEPITIIPMRAKCVRELEMELGLSDMLYAAQDRRVLEPDDVFDPHKVLRLKVKVLGGAKKRGSRGKRKNSARKPTMGQLRNMLKSYATSTEAIDAYAKATTNITQPIGLPPIATSGARGESILSGYCAHQILRKTMTSSTGELHVAVVPSGYRDAGYVMHSTGDGVISNAAYNAVGTNDQWNFNSFHADGNVGVGLPQANDAYAELGTTAMSSMVAYQSRQPDVTSVPTRVAVRLTYIGPVSDLSGVCRMTDNSVAGPVNVTGENSGNVGLHYLSEYPVIELNVFCDVYDKRTVASNSELLGTTLYTASPYNMPSSFSNPLSATMNLGGSATTVTPYMGCPVLTLSLSGLQSTASFMCETIVESWVAPRYEKYYLTNTRLNWMTDSERHVLRLLLAKRSKELEGSHAITAAQRWMALTTETSQEVADPTSYSLLAAFLSGAANDPRLLNMAVNGVYGLVNAASAFYRPAGVNRNRLIQ